MLRFGIFLSYQRLHSPEDYKTDLFAEKLREAVEADRLGYDIIWVPEHHLIHFMQTPSAHVLGTQIGLNVGCQVGTMVSLLTLRHPLISAGELALVDHLLEGRLEIGVGRGAYEYEFERLGVPFAEGKDRFHEALDVLEQVWHSPERSVAYEGRFNTFDDAYVWPRPLQAPHPPLWYAAMSPPSVDWAARQGYHVTNWPFLRGMDAVAHVAETFHTAREASGGVQGQQRLGIMRGAFAAATEAEVDARVDEALVNHRINQRLHYFTQNADSRAVVAPEPVEKEPSKAEIYENLVMGTPDRCLEKIEQYERLGVDDLLLMFDYGSPHDVVMDSMRLFAEEVIAPYRAARQAVATPIGS